MNNFRFSRLLVMVGLCLAGIGLLAQMPQPVQAQGSVRCRWGLDGKTWRNLGNMTAERCVYAVTAQGAALNSESVLGQAGSLNFVVQQDGSVLNRDTQAVLGTLQDLDGDSFLYEACPRDTENLNGIFDTDGCPDTIETLVNLAAKDINEFWQAEFTEGKLTYRNLNRMQPYYRRTTTGCGRAIPNNAFYCSRNRSIYYDAQFLTNLVTEGGDYAAVMVISHEWGHFVQHQLGILKQDLYSIEIELQADCFAGAYAGRLSRGESDNVSLDPGDLDEGVQAAYAFGDDASTPWDDPVAHGSPEQRADAFQTGLEQGADACLK